MSTVSYSKEEVEKTFDKVTEELGQGGLYAPALRRLKIRKNASVPKSILDGMRERGSAICTDGEAIYTETALFASMLNRATEEYLKNHAGCNSLYDEVRNVVIHELTHVICRHSYQGLKIFDERKKHSGRDATYKELMCWKLACDIEANRGYGIWSSGSPIYAAGVTEDKYPETVKDKYLLDIFETLLEKYQDEVAEDMNALGSNQSEGNSSEENTSSQPSKAEARRQAMKEMVEQDALSNIPLEEVYEPNLQRNHEEVFDGEGQMYSHGGDDIDVSGKTGEQIAEEQFHEWQTANVERSLAKLKGTIMGKVSFERVPTYSRQSRKTYDGGIIKKGYKRAPHSSPSILLALDKSGSMDGTTTAKATSAVAKIFEATGRPTTGCYICLHDGRVSNLEPLKKWKDVTAKFYASGGNNFSEVVKLANKLKVDVVLNVGDAGDNTSGNPGESKQFMKANRKWVDVDIVSCSGGNSKSLGSRTRYLKPLYESDKKGGVKREYIDLTGQSDISKELQQIFES